MFLDICLEFLDVWTDASISGVSFVLDLLYVEDGFDVLNRFSVGKRGVRGLGTVFRCSLALLEGLLCIHFAAASMLKPHVGSHNQPRSRHRSRLRLL